MEDFISIIRTDRKREIDYYKHLGYTFVDDSKYILINRITVHTDKNDYNIGVQVDGYEVYYYLIDDGANYYLSIYDIYKALLQISDKEGKDLVINTLKKSLTRTRKAKDTFSYKGVHYELHHVELPNTNGFVMLDGASKEIDYEHLFVLIALIQEKSNAFFGRSQKPKDKKYKNGIIRLFIILISKENDIPLLTNLGWFWKSTGYAFDRSKVRIKDERNKKKYYLTNDEYKAIM